MKVLTHKQQIKVDNFRFRSEIAVYTIKGCWEDDSKSPYRGTLEDYMAQDLRNGGTYAWTYRSPSGLTSDYPGKAEAMRKKAEAYDNAVVLENGETVEIDGQYFAVKIVGENYSDPIHFEKK